MTIKDKLEESERGLEHFKNKIIELLTKGKCKDQLCPSVNDELLRLCDCYNSAYLENNLLNKIIKGVIKYED